ncbi:hypothetical protein KCP69_14905 [Salmonella enterica subsp. enterica]|nr:hypothetical protein KCP69_14905 [Salmonella enterica subsp. enterica]
MNAIFSPPSDTAVPQSMLNWLIFRYQHIDNFHRNLYHLLALIYLSDEFYARPGRFHNHERIAFWRGSAANMGSNARGSANYWSSMTSTRWFYSSHAIHSRPRNHDD